MIPHEDVTARILALAEESPSKTISGGRLSELLKHHFPGFTTSQYGAKNIRAFIRTNLFGKLNEVGRVGMDIVYGIPGAIPAPAPSRPQPSRYIPLGHLSPDAFRVFKSPNSPFELHANRDTGAIRILDVGSHVEDPWVRIKPASPETLLQIAKEFAAQLPEDSQREYLTTVLDQSPHAWWQKVWPYVQARGLSGLWLAFKNKQLQSRLEAELRERGVMTSGISTTPLGSVQKLDNTSHREGNSGEDSGLYDLRDVIVKVVRNLPLSELRNLKLPVGEIFDAIKRQH